MEKAERSRFLNSYPILSDGTEKTPFDRHYFYQDIWAMRRIYKSGVRAHIDVGSRVDFVGMLSTLTYVTFIDIRPLEVQLEGLDSKKGSILELPYPDSSLPSISCLHVAEHIGLGRYGDPLDPCGTQKATVELSRVLARGGSLYFSLPTGKPRLCFNAHRIHSPQQIIAYFATLDLVEFSVIDDERKFHENVDYHHFEETEYACGLFWFKKPSFRGLNSDQERQEPASLTPATLPIVR